MRRNRKLITQEPKEMVNQKFQISVNFSTLLSVALIIIVNIYNCHAQSIRTESYEVLIIGAGPSGIAAASRLMENGVTNITILEAENRLGGRVYSVPFDHGVLDMGAQWVHGEKGNVVFEMAEKLNLLEASKVSEESFNPCFLVSSGQVFDPELSSPMMDFMNEIQNISTYQLHESNESLGEYFTRSLAHSPNVTAIKLSMAMTSDGDISDITCRQRSMEQFAYSIKEVRFEEKVVEKNLNNKASKYFLRWYQKYRNSVDGSDSWFETSAMGDAEYWECEGNQAVSWKFGGYANVFNLLMNKYTSDKPPIFADKKIKYNKEVTQIDWENSTSIVVHCSDGSSYEAPHVIVTVSLGVLKEKANTMFHPALPPAKLRAIEGLGIGTVNKIYVKFTHRWWPNDCNGFNLLWTDEDINSDQLPVNAGEHVDSKQWLQEVFGFYEVDNHPLVLCGWIVGPASRHMETLSNEQLMADVVYIMEKFIGRALNVSIPQPERIIRSSWSSNPHFRGSYSFRSVNSVLLQTSAFDLSEPLTDLNGVTMLQFAGEATNPHHYSTVHGAVESGWREADRILAHHGGTHSLLV